MTAPERIQRFRIDGVLGEGGMGTVYRAFDPELARPVAIKVLANEAPQLAELDEHHTLDLRADRPRSGDELLAEARLMAAISHPNVLPIYEVGRTDGRVFLVMELVDGVDLRAWLAAATRDVAELVRVLVDGARGLAAAHERGIVHRDLKPDNILIGRDGRVRVADFGVASLLATPGSLVRVGDARGTPAYMAPELWRGAAPTPASDVYAFAVTAVEALLGAPPSTEDRPGLATALEERGVPLHVRVALLAALASAPAARPADGGALALALEPPPPRARKRTLAIAAGAVAAVAGGVAVAMLGSGEPAATCELDPARHAALWSPARAAALRERIAGAVTAGELDHIVAHLDRQLADEAALRLAACEELASGKLGTAQHAVRIGCLDRRMVELDARLAYALERDVTARFAAVLARGMPAVAECATQAGKPLAPAQARELRELYGRYIDAVVGRDDEFRATVEELLPRVVAVGDLELAARMGNALAQDAGAARERERARELFEQARGYARELGSASAEVRVVSEHARYELAIGELGIAHMLAKDAKALLARAPDTANTQKVLTQIAHVAKSRGEVEEATEHYRRALDQAERRGRGRTRDALELRLAILQGALVLDRTTDDRARTRALADESLGLARELVPEHDSEHRRALFLASSAYGAAGDRDRARELEQRALALLRASKPAPGMTATQHSAQLAGELFLRGRYPESVALLRQVIAETDRLGPDDLGAMAARGTYLELLGTMLAVLGEPAQARPLLEEAVLELTGRLGASHARVFTMLGILISTELDLGELAAAARHVDTLERGIRARPPGDPIELARVAMLRARLARERGELADAERRSREGLATLGELAATPKQRRPAILERARILAALGRHDEAIAHFLQLRPDEDRRVPGDLLYEFELARSERAVGRAADAARHARRALASLGDLPGFAEKRAEIEAWLAAGR